MKKERKGSRIKLLNMEVRRTAWQGYLENHQAVMPGTLPDREAGKAAKPGSSIRKPDSDLRARCKAVNCKIFAHI